MVGGAAPLLAIERRSVSGVSLATLMSPAFGGFDDRVFATGRARIVIETDGTDMMASIAIAEFACQLTRRRGDHLCPTELSARHHRLIDLGRQGGCDRLRAFSPTMLTAWQRAGIRAWIAAVGAGRVILAGADVGDAVAFGAAAGIELFQGRYVDHLRRDHAPHRPPFAPPPR